MGQITEITEDNIDELTEILGEDIAENIGREYYYGLTSCDPLNEPVSAIVWCIKNADSFDDREAELCYFSSEDEEDGEELIQEYTDRIGDENVIRSFFEFEDGKDDAGKMLKASGFSASKKEGKNLYGTLGEFSKMSFASKKQTPSYIVGLDSLNMLQFRQGVTNCMFCGRVGINEDLAMLPMEWYEMDISSAMITDGKVNGFFLVHKKPSGVLMPVLLYATGVDARKEMLNMLRFSVNAALEKYPANTKVLIKRHDEKTKALTAYFFPGRKGKKALCGEREEGE